MIWQKKTERLLLRVSEDMAQAVRELAEAEHRSIQDQLRYLIAVGLKHHQSEVLKENGERSRLLRSTGVNSRRAKSEEVA